MTTKNRIALILLDSDFEIALKEFIVHKLIGFSMELCVYLFSPDPIGKVSEFFGKIDR